MPSPLRLWELKTVSPRKLRGPCPCLPLQIEVKLSVKFTSREFSLKRMPSRKQTGVFGVKIAVVTK